MSVRYSPDPAVWISVPQDAAADWARQTASKVAAAPWLVSALVEAGQDLGDAETRLVLVHPGRQQAVVVDLDMLDLGADLPDPVDLDEGSTATTEEFTAGVVHGRRTVWVSPAPGVEASGEDALRAQALFVGSPTGTGYLITLRTGQLPLGLVVDTLTRCEELLATAEVA